MALQGGDRVAHFEIVAPVGAGGMGEVYRARDTRLGRDVALKVLPEDLAADPDRLRRFEQEARAVAALNHPNILALYDVGTHEGAPYIVTELLEGESLREKLHAGTLPVRRAVGIGVQVARGLAAAHEKGIVHRDLKPGNVFVTDDGQVKILDFGLAKLAPPRSVEEQARASTIVEATDAGTVLGTVAYMSPEQVLGKALDPRSDLFSLGVVLYEMVSGTRPFQRESPPETMAAILKAEPSDLAETGQAVPPGLARIVQHCLEKEPSGRFRSAHDVAFALESVTQATSAATAPLRRVGGGRRVLAAAGAVGLLGVLGVGLLLLGMTLGKRSARPPSVRFQQLTFRRGWVSSARFTADGHTVVYSASWLGAPTELFSTRPGSPESAALGYAHAHLLAVSSTGELALLRSPDELTLIRSPDEFRPQAPSTLAVAPFSGGTPRDVVDAGLAADYSADGRAMALARMTGTGTQLEYPIGTVLAQGVWGTRPSYQMLRLSVLRISPDGRSLAYFKDGKELIVSDMTGASKPLASVPDPSGLAWSSDGREVWFGNGRELRAVTPSGTERVVYSQPDRMILHDIARDGRALLAVGRQQRSMFFHGDGETDERNLSWLDWTAPMSLSADGRLVAFHETELGVGVVPTVFVRETNGAPAVRLGNGFFPCLSADGRFVAAVREATNDVAVYPVGPGSARIVPVSGVRLKRACLLADGATLGVFGTEPGRGDGFWAVGPADRSPRRVSPEGSVGIYPWITPDGRCGIGEFKGAVWLYPFAGGEPRALTGVQADDVIAALGADGTVAFVYRSYELPYRVYRVDLRTGARELFRQLPVTDRSGLGWFLPQILMTPDGRSYVYAVTRLFSELYLVEGLT